MGVSFRKRPLNADKTRHRDPGSGHGAGSYSSLAQALPPTPNSSHPTVIDSVMLKVTVLRPLCLGRSATATLRPVARNFSSLGSKTTTNSFNAASNRSRVSPSSFWSKCSRAFMTDSSAVTVRPTQAEAWKKYAVTAVSLALRSCMIREMFIEPLFLFRLPLPELSLLPMCS